MSDRDFLGDMAKQIIDAIPEGSDFVATDIATNVYAKVSQTDPELLQGWLAAQAVGLISQHVTARRSYLARTAVRQKAHKFQEAAEAFQQGDTEPLSVFLQTVSISPDAIVRPIGKLTKDNALWISEQRAKTSKSLAFEAAFYSAVAAKIPEGKVLEEVMSELEFLQLRESLAL